MNGGERNNITRYDKKTDLNCRVKKTVQMGDMRADDLLVRLKRPTYVTPGFC